ncbi:MAG: DUF433 domain-containing protein [Flavobacteriales bacterium]|nr:DUF433 domain-containing protein [Flavobacteriales bacterium]
MSQEPLKRITVDDRICNGRPVIRGMRITVQTILEFMMAGTPDEDILDQYPVLEKADLDACRAYAIQLSGNGFSLRNFAA